MAKCGSAARAAIAVAASLYFGAPGLAQTAPDAASAKSSELDAQKAAFLAMPEADRKAVQDALGWLGLYNGTVDGTFGKRTLDSILAYQGKMKAKPDGVVSSLQLAALKTAADKARAAVGFQLIDDSLTGARIGAPLKLLDKKTTAAGRTRLASRDGLVTLELIASTAALADSYNALVADTPGRRITYKAMKPDAFFVIAGEDGGRKSYVRYARAPAGTGDPEAVRGFVLTYPADQAAALDAMALAIANSFDPFPSKALTVRPVEPTPTLTPTPTPTPSLPALRATALMVGSGQALTALSEADCREPTINGKSVQFLRTDPASGLALLGGDLGKDVPVPSLGEVSADLVVLSLAPAGAPGKVVLEAADANLVTIAGANARVVAALAASARGAPVFDRQGGLTAVVAPLAAAPKLRGAVVLAEPHEAIGVEALKRFAGFSEAASAGQALGAADIVRRARGAIVGVFCAP